MQAKHKGLIGILVAAPLVVPMSGLLAQEGKQASFTIGERLRYVEEDGFATPQNEGFSLVTTLDYSFRSQTPSDTLSFDLGTAIPLYADDNTNFNSTFTFEDPYARVGYIRENRTSELSFNASYRRTDVGLSNFFDETINEDVVTGSGKRELYSAGVGLTLGRDTPVTTRLGYRYLRSEYIDADPGLDDSTTQTLDARVDFRISPVASVFVFADWREEVRDRLLNPTRTTTSYEIGTDYAVSSVTNLTARLSYDDDRNDNRSNDGLGFRLGWGRELPDGRLNFDLFSEETIDGLRNQVSAGRTYALRRGSLGFSLGAVKEEGGEVEPLANLNLNLAVNETSRFNISLSQSAEFDDNDRNVIRTRLAIGYNYDINSASSLSANLRLANDNRFGSNTADSRSALASLTYNHDIGDNWGLVSGISYETDQQDRRRDRNTSTVFVGLEKTFNFRP